MANIKQMFIDEAFYTDKDKWNTAFLDLYLKLELAEKERYFYTATKRVKRLVNIHFDNLIDLEPFEQVGVQEATAILVDYYVEYGINFNRTSGSFTIGGVSGSENPPADPDYIPEGVMTALADVGLYQFAGMMVNNCEEEDYPDNYKWTGLNYPFKFAYTVQSVTDLPTTNVAYRTYAFTKGNRHWYSWDGDKWIDLGVFTAAPDPALAGFVGVPTELVKWTDAYGRTIDLSAATTDAEVKQVIDEWLIGFNSEGLGWPDNTGILHKKEENFFKGGDLFAVLAPIAGHLDNVVWIQGFPDASGELEFKVVSLSGGAAGDLTKYVLKTVFNAEQTAQNVKIDKNSADMTLMIGDIQANKIGVAANAAAIVIDKKALADYKTAYDKYVLDQDVLNKAQDVKISKNETNVADNKAKIAENLVKIEKNKKDLELAAIEIDANSRAVKNKMNMHDYTKITTQKELYDKVIADNIQPGEILKLTLAGQEVFVRATGLNKTTRIFTYTILGDAKDALGNDETKLLKGRASGLMTVPLMANFLGTLGVKQIDLEQAASEDFHAVREKEFKVTHDLSEENERKIKAITGEALVIGGNSFNKGLAKLAEAFKVPLPTGYTSWLAAINAEVGFDSLFDATTGLWLTTPRAQWAKVNLFDKIPAGTTPQPVRFNIAFRGYTGTTGTTLSTDLDQLIGSAEKGDDQKVLVKEYMALTLYRQPWTVQELQNAIDLVSGGSAGFSVDNIIKAKNVPANAKYADGTTVNTQAGAANSKDEQKIIDDAQDAALAKLRADINQALKDKADADFVNAENIAEKGKFFKWNDVTGRIEFVTLPAGGGGSPITQTHTQLSYRLAANTALGTSGESAYFGRGFLGTQYYGEGANAINVGTSAKTVRIGNSANMVAVGGDAETVSLGQGGSATGSLRIGLDTESWITIGSARNDKWKSQNKLIQGTKSATFEEIIDAAHRKNQAPGTQLYTTILDSHTNRNAQTWTDASGAQGFWRALVADDNQYNVAGTDFTTTITRGTDRTPYSVRLDYMTKYKNLKFVLAKIPAATLTNPHLKINLQVATAYRTHNSKLTEAEAKIVIQKIVDYFYNPTPALAQDLYTNHHMISSQSKEIEWDDVETDTATLSGTPTLITATKNTATYTLLKNMHLYATKDAKGDVELFLQDPNAYDPSGEDGPFFIPLRLAISMADAGANIGTGTGASNAQVAKLSADIAALNVKENTLDGRVTANELDIVNIKQSVGEKHDIPTNDATATAGQFLARTGVAGASEWKDLPAGGVTSMPYHGTFANEHDLVLSTGAKEGEFAFVEDTQTWYERHNNTWKHHVDSGGTHGSTGGTTAGTFTMNADKLVANDTTGSAVDNAYIGKSYPGSQHYGEGGHSVGVGDRASYLSVGQSTATMHIGYANTGKIDIGAAAQGSIQIGSIFNAAHKAENKLIQGSKSATFEQIIDKALEPAGGGTPLTKTITLVFDDGTTEDIKVG